MTEEEILAYIDSTMADAVKIVMDKLSSQPVMSNEINVPMLIDRLQFYMEPAGSNDITFTVTDTATGYRKYYIFNLISNRGYAHPLSSEIPF